MGEKMSKSTHHYFLIEDILKDYSPNTIRLFLLKTHYRNQIEFSRERLNEARNAFGRIVTYLDNHKEEREITQPMMFTEFNAAMNDDLNTPKALGYIFDLVNQGYKKHLPEIAASIRKYLNILGFITEKKKTDNLSTRLIELILKTRNSLRKEKNYNWADEIRRNLKDLGVIIDDTEDASRYHLTAK
jgi:cysteinyl-tRNA synthetase